MNKLREAQFEERRHAWIGEISSQWIGEHMDCPGIRRDVSVAVSRECQKMWEKLCKNEMTDVPQALLLRIARMTEFLEWNYSVAAAASNSFVTASGTDKQWMLEPNLNSEEIATQVIREHAQTTKEMKGEWWSGPLKILGGLPLFALPIAGFYGACATTGYGLGEIHNFLTTVHVDFEVLQDKVPLLQFGIALERLDVAARQIAYLLGQQKFGEFMRFAVLEDGPDDVRFLLEPLSHSSEPKWDMVPLKSVAAPIHLPVLVK